MDKNSYWEPCLFGGEVERKEITRSRAIEVGGERRKKGCGGGAEGVQLKEKEASVNRD